MNLPERIKIQSSLRKFEMSLDVVFIQKMKVALSCMAGRGRPRFLPVRAVVVCAGVITGHKADQWQTGIGSTAAAAGTGTGATTGDGILN